MWRSVPRDLEWLVSCHSARPSSLQYVYEDGNVANIAVQDSTSWQSQVEFFKSAVKVSPHAGIDCVVANAGIADQQGKFDVPEVLDAKDPPPPSLSVIDVNLTGVLYTTHLALFWLPRNPNSVPASPKANTTETPRDRHLLLLSSMAGLGPIPGQALYTASKHAVVGLFRSLRSTAFMHGVRVNMLCPYFVDTPILSSQARLLLAGTPMGKLEDVVDAATRFASDPHITGRAAMIGPKLKAQQGPDGQWEWADRPDMEEKAVLEIYVDDFEEADLSARRIVTLLNRVVEIRGWSGWLMDILAALRYRLGL